MTPRSHPSFQSENRYIEVLAAIEQHNPALIYVTTPQWFALIDFVPARKRRLDYDDAGEAIMVVEDEYGMTRTFRRKRPSREPEGTLDLTVEPPEAAG